MPLALVLAILLAMLRRRVWLIVALFALTGGAAAVHILSAPPSYVAETNVLVKFGREHSLRSYGEGDRILPANYAQDQIVSSTVEIMQSANIERRLVEMLGYERLYPVGPEAGFFAQILALAGLAESGGGAASGLVDMEEVAVRRLKDDIQIVPQGRSNVVRVRMSHRDPETAALAVNTFVDEFLARYSEIHGENLVPQMQLEYERAQARLNEVQSRLVGFEREHFLFEQDGQLERLVDRKNRLDQQLLRLEECCVESAAVLTVRNELEGLEQRMLDATTYRSSHRELVRQRTWAEGQLNQALQRLQDARHGRSLDDGASSIQIISPAEPSLATARPSREVRLALAFVFALLLSGSVALALEFLHRRYSSPAELQAAFGIPVLAYLPRSKRAAAGEDA